MIGLHFICLDNCSAIILLPFWACIEPDCSIYFHRFNQKAYVAKALCVCVCVLEPLIVVLEGLLLAFPEAEQRICTFGNLGVLLKKLAANASKSCFQLLMLH